MFIRALRVRGFRDLPELSLRDLSRVVRVRGPSPAATALGDALQLLFAALHPPDLQTLLRRWELLAPDECAEITGERLPEQATWTDPVGARALVPEDGERALSVTAEIVLDPPLTQALRSATARDLEILAALMGGPRLELGVGALLTTTHDALAISIQRFAVGEARLALHGSERPPWLPGFLDRLRGRLCMHQPRTLPAARILEAATSRDGHAAYQRWAGALTPDGPELRAARGAGETPVILGDGLPLRRWGRPARDRAALAADVFLSGADILWAETDDAWLDEQVEGEGSALEQVFRVCTDGEVELT